MSEKATRVVIWLGVILVVAVISMYSACTHAMEVGRREASARPVGPQIVTLSDTVAMAPSTAVNTGLKVGILRSDLNTEFYGWRSEWTLRGAKSCLARLGLKAEMVNLETLLAGAWQGNLLVLPDVRAMDSDTVAAVRSYVQNGGHVLATYQTSYRDKDNRALQSSNFALADVYGADFFRWSGLTGNDGFLKSESLGVKSPVQLGQTQAMLIKPHEGTTVLACWGGAGERAAVVRKGNVIYCGVDLFAPENCSSAQVCDLVAALLNNLLQPGHGQAALLTTPIARSKGDDGSSRRVATEMPVQPAVVGGEEISVGLLQTSSDVMLVAPQGASLSYTLATSGTTGVLPELRVRPVSTVGEPERLALYDGTGKLLIRTSEHVQVACCVSNPASADGAGATEVANPNWLELLSLNPNGTYAWSAYRGSLLLGVQGQRVHFINKLALESYLQGVVPNEMPAYFHPTALEAMACVARSYTLAHLQRHKSEGFGLCSGVHCHVYGGLSSEDAKVNEAVSNTSGTALYYDGKVVDATYHAVCGGYSDAPDAVWKGSSAQPYLSAMPDAETQESWGSSEEDFRSFIDNSTPAFCEAASRFRWTESYSRQEITDKLRQSLPVLLGVAVDQVGTLKSLDVVRRTAGGRVADLAIQTDKGTFHVGGDSVRWLTSGGKVGGAAGLRSALFYVVCDGDNVTFCGGGWGHGVGLCQEGAGGRAVAGHSCAEILNHYYPGAQVAGGHEVQE